MKVLCLTLRYVPNFFSLISLTQAEELFETSSEEEAADAEETSSVIDVEDLGNIMSHMKKAKVLSKYRTVRCLSLIN